MTHSQFFRAGVGTVIYTASGDIILFRRADMPSVWQLPQGGMDAGETPKETLWRELQEETGLTTTDVTCTHEYPDWLYYEYTPDIRSRLRDPNTRGQMHRWYFLQLAPDVTIDVTTAMDKEFTDHKTSQFTELTASQHPHNQLKRAVYTKLADYYTAHIIPDLPTT